MERQTKKPLSPKISITFTKILSNVLCPNVIAIVDKRLNN